jgi:hypothetical protein
MFRVCPGIRWGRREIHVMKEIFRDLKKEYLPHAPKL